MGRRLSEHGARVLTSLTGRSIATIRRAEMTGTIGADDDAIAQADVILSILPPNEAFALAERLVAPLSRASHKAICADCNAINVETVRRIDAVITPTGAAFVDGGMIGSPPGQRGNPTFYFSGQAAPALAGLCDLDLNVRIMEAPLGAASALKMSYAGINKGTTLLQPRCCWRDARRGRRCAPRRIIGKPARASGSLCPINTGHVSKSSSLGARDGRDRRIPRRRSRRPPYLPGDGGALSACRSRSERRAGGDPVSGRIYRQADRASLKAAGGLAHDSPDGASVAALSNIRPSRRSFSLV